HRGRRAVDLADLLVRAGRVAAAAAVAGLVMATAYRALLDRWQIPAAALGAGTAGAVVELGLVGLPGLAGCAVYLLLLVLLRAPEAGDLLEVGLGMAGRLRRFVTGRRPAPEAAGSR
ncbi:MAG TPA: murein biosynthesis integral membrane protein MurJ, partial [Thermaerobacter sp.]